MDCKNVKILVSDQLSDKGISIMKDAGLNVTVNTKLSKEQLLAEIKNYDALVVRSATKVTADVIKAGVNLSIIARAGTGVDNIDCDAASEAGVMVMNTPNSNTISAAEHTCAMISSLSRFIPQAYLSMQKGAWNRNQFMGSELYGKTLAIIGMGRIGREVSKRMQSFGMKVLGYDPYFSDEQLASFNVEPTSLNSLWGRADYITIHVPLSEETKNLINKDVLHQCKSTVRIINVARGGIVNEDDVFTALKENKCGGVALDVFCEEPPKNLDLLSHPLVICTPHLGASTFEAQERVAEDVASQLVNYFHKNEIVGVINANAKNVVLKQTKNNV